ncbi:MAG: twin-arginine translocase TatA/TatE family subunit [Cyclobacteriaceae bacterium]
MNTLLFIGGLGGWEVLLIVAIVLILFGAKKIPELARGLGTGIKEFKNATTEVNKEWNKEEDTKSSKTVPTPEPQNTSTTASAPVAEPAPTTKTPEEVNHVEVVENEEEKKSNHIA